MPGEDPTGGLTAAEAAARSAVVSVTSYDVTLDLTGLPEGEYFSSRSIVEFSYDGDGGPGMTWLDLVADGADHVVLDGVALDPGEVVRGDRVRLAPLGGRHRLEVLAWHRAGSGRGLSRSADHAVYAWTQFQPFDARRAFACFDQPDLKATFAFEVRVPLDWHCVSNRQESEVVEEGDVAVWTFPPTPPLPTYAAAVCAGPFHVVRSDRGPVPMSLCARRSLAGALERDAEEIFELSRRALALFEDAFGIAYDGDSYDHVFLPDQPGAMENHGCVTWNDQVLYRSEPTAEQRRRRALVLLHEMSHMWFGNLVTPRWWDGLWLSESFADWAALWAAAQLGVLDSRWSVATALEKERAADADLLSSTHPVSRPVPDIAAAEANFDAITYAKGACMLRQLVASVGEDAFLEALRKYFAQHAGENGSLRALITAVQPFTEIDLSAWSRVWLESSGITTLTLDVTDTGVTVVQNGVARPHLVSIGVYGGAPLAEVDRIDLRVAEPRTEVPALSGRSTAPLLLLDDRDTTYALLRPDPRSVRTLVAAGTELEDPLARNTARRTIRGLLLDGPLPAAEVVEYVASSLTTETDPVHLKALTSLGLEAAGTYATPPQRESLERKLAAACVAALGSADSAARIVLVEALADCADTGDQLQLVDSLLADSEVPQLIRWRLLTRLVALGFADSEQIDAAEDRDADPDAVWQAAAARAAMPIATAKDVALDRLLTSPGVPTAVLRTFGPALWQPRQTVLLTARATEFLGRLVPFAHETDWFAAARVVRYAFPATAVSEPFVARVHELAATSELAPILRQSLEDQAEMAQRALAAQRLTADGQVR
ncbi:aminopeptidase N [Kribbella turkmenica]|uniref:Aminopeptidase N n=1 Tax=Kribbella turkmenica TaxID=2530375 RepID=A0A4R4WXY4_9ACTN|nr:aminopeptidase N [Kribbella turkmenica]TDD22638.1 aminopeptidase N [Kribbella turkmenica]